MAHDAALRHALHTWLADGPMRTETLVALGQERGLLDADEDEAWDALTHHLDTTNEYWRIDHESIDEQVASSGAVLEGRTLTHRVTSEDLAEGTLDAGTDLLALLSDVDQLPFADGGVVHLDLRPLRLRGPLRWLDSLGEGDLVAVTRAGGVLSLAPVDRAADGEAERRALAAAAEDWIDDRRGSEAYPLVMDALVRHPDLFRAPTVPVSELLADLGLERRGHEWGPSGTPWRTLQEQLGLSSLHLASNWGFDRCCIAAMRVASDALVDHRATGGFGATDPEAVATALAHGAVIDALVSDGADELTSLAAFAHDLAGSCRERRGASARALAGFVALESGQPAAAVDLLDRAVLADPRLGSARLLLSSLELDRGDLERAARLVEADDLDPDLASTIRGEIDRRALLRPRVGRNDPCPCGSGRKAKQCCRGSGPPSLQERERLVLLRLALHADRRKFWDRRHRLAEIAAEATGDGIGEVDRFLDDPFLRDLAVHDLGVGSHYLAERGPLLPADERSLVEEVLAAPRRLWELTAVDEGASLELRDASTGACVFVEERRGSLGRRVGELVLSHLVAVDGRASLVGAPITVRPEQRQPMLDLLDGDPGPEQFAAWLGRVVAEARRR